MRKTKRLEFAEITIQAEKSKKNVAKLNDPLLISKRCILKRQNQISAFE